MIIVEGPDGAGKTTLVEKLEEQLGITREPRAVSAGAKKLVPISDWIETEIDKGFGLRLYDRFALISSPMYISLPDRTFSEQMLDLGWLQDQYRHLRKVNPVIIVCLPPFEEVRKNLRKSEEAHYDSLVDHWETVYWNYHNWLAEHMGLSTSLVHYDYTATGGMEALQNRKMSGIINWAKARVEKKR